MVVGGSTGGVGRLANEKAAKEAEEKQAAVVDAEQTKKTEALRASSPVKTRKKILWPMRMIWI